jgi:dual specificity tyrosine-phosphorylation-regulated kinase 2/3/4
MDQLGNSDNSTEFLPSVGFDELHASLTSYDSDVNNFPPPVTRDGLNTFSITTPVNTNMRIPHNTVIAKEREQTGKISRSQSLVRRFSNAPGKGSQSSVTLDTTAMPPPSAPAAGKGRRQSTLSSTLPQAGATQASRPPRKSVGPNFLSQTTASRAASRESRVTPSHSTPSLIRTSSITRPNRLAPAVHGTLTTHEPSGPAARNLRTKSLQPPPRGQTHALLSSSAATPVNDPSIGTAVSPRAQRQGSHTPSSANGNRRLSTIYVGGLGARTISPTDARRNRRMSAVPKNVALPQPSFASQSELTSIARASTQSPALPVRQSVTPSSARNTPDFGRRAVNASLQSMSSSSSFSSLRMNTTGGPRNSQILSASRLPTPKPRNVHSSAGIADEEVPPVPAIPKAYESPKDQHHPEPSYFVPRRPAGSDIEDPGAITPVSQMQKMNTKPNATGTPAPMTDAQKRDSRQANNPRHRRGLTVGAGAEPERHVIPQPSLNKKNLQPLRLPPLNLLPLSTPTSARIASLPTPMGDHDGRHQTPPPTRNFTKTPSTPMTASKATFFSRSRPDEDGFHMFNNFRSNSSHHLMRSESVDVHDVQVSLSAGMAIPMGAPRSTASPFSSNSLPRTGDFGSMSTPQTGTPVDSFNYSHPFIPGLEADGLGSPQPSPKMAQPTLQGPNPSARTSSSDEPGTPASTTSLRRKLSLTWKRSSSKASQRAQAAAAAAQAEKDEQNRKQNGMPPPKMPASATWTSRNSSDTGSSRPSLDIRARMNSNGVTQNQSEAGGIPHYVPSTQQRSQTEVGKPKAETIQPPPPYADHRRVASRSSSSSILSPVQRILGSKSSLSTLRGRNLDTNLDKDDLAADKIMEKLASKRKDFESAAKEVDELRRRAYPKERVSPSQAIQMVNLNIFERGEIVDYKEVYFCGTRNAKKHVGDLDVQTNNFGYDDDRGDYNIIMGDHLAYRYEVVDMLGKGSFGQVVRCIDHKTGGLVAIKIIRNKKRFHQQALVEVNILQKLREWVCVRLARIRTLLTVCRTLKISTA